MALLDRLSSKAYINVEYSLFAVEELVRQMNAAVIHSTETSSGGPMTTSVAVDFVYIFFVVLFVYEESKNVINIIK